jgi:hypothetical protein
VTTPALAVVRPHRVCTGTVAQRVQVAESFLLVEARRLADSLGLEDVRALLTGAALLADVVDFEDARR